MFETKPIKVIKGLFNNYLDEQNVTAAEYNGNITALKTAIEHNGNILDNHNEALQSLMNQQIPIKSIETDKLADGAVTTEKLAPEVQYELNTLKPDCFGDLLLQFHKKNLGIYGTFMNGAIVETALRAVQPIQYTTTIKRIKANVGVLNASGDYSATEDVVVDNAWLSENNVTDYNLVNLKADGRPMCSFDCAWDTTYTFDKPITLDSNTNFEFFWTCDTNAGYREGFYSDGVTWYDEQVTGSSSITQIALQYADSADFKPVTTGFAKTSREISKRHPCTEEIKLNWDKTTSYTNVKAIRIRTEFSLYIDARHIKYYNPEYDYTTTWEGYSPGADGDMLFKKQTTCAYTGTHYNIGLKTFTTNTLSNADNMFQVVLPTHTSLDKLPNSKIGLRIKNNATALTEDNAKISIRQYLGFNYMPNELCGHAGFATSSVLDYLPICPDTLNTNFKIEDASNKIYYITQDLITPIIVCGFVDKKIVLPEGWHNAGIELKLNNRYYWYLVPNTKNITYIYPNNVQEVVATLTALGLTNIECRYFNSPTAQTSLQIWFNSADAELQDICIIKESAQNPIYLSKEVDEV